MPVHGTTVETGHCFNCGLTNDIGLNFCASCGNLMNAQSAQSSSQNANMFDQKRLIKGTMGLSSYGNTDTTFSTEYNLDGT